MARNRYNRKPYQELPAEPFPSTEDAWLWGVRCLIARRDGARPIAGEGSEIRPCEPEDIVKSVERLYRIGRLTRQHLNVLVDYGAKSTLPNGHDRNESRAARLWDEAIDLLTTPFKQKGIVAE